MTTQEMNTGHSYRGKDGITRKLTMRSGGQVHYLRKKEKRHRKMDLAAFADLAVEDVTPAPIGGRPR